MKKTVFILTAILSLIFLMSCTQFVLPKEESVQVKVLLTDKPVKDLEKLDVYITSFKYHYVTYENDEGIWSEEIPVATQVDILSLAGTEA